MLNPNFRMIIGQISPLLKLGDGENVVAGEKALPHPAQSGIKAADLLKKVAGESQIGPRQPLAFLIQFFRGIGPVHDGEGRKQFIGEPGWPRRFPNGIDFSPYRAQRHGRGAEHIDNFFQPGWISDCIVVEIGYVFHEVSGGVGGRVVHY